MSEELFNLHQVISELQIAEDVMLDNHKQSQEGLMRIAQQLGELLMITDNVAYDQEGNWSQLWVLVGGN